MFRDRLDAARQLASRLDHLKGQHPLVLAIPRGAVPMGAELARLLDGQLNVVLVRKLRAPWQPELAIGAVDETGWTWVPEEPGGLALPPSYLQEETRRQLATIRERRRRYTPIRAPVASREALALVAPMADEVVCLLSPVEFSAVGQFYRDFDQVEDDEVERILRG